MISCGPFASNDFWSSTACAALREATISSTCCSGVNADDDNDNGCDPRKLDEEDDDNEGEGEGDEGLEGGGEGRSVEGRDEWRVRFALILSRIDPLVLLFLWSVPSVCSPPDPDPDPPGWGEGFDGLAIDLKTFFDDPTAGCLDRDVVWVASRLENDEDDDEDENNDGEEDDDEEDEDDDEEEEGEQRDGLREIV